MSLVSMLSDGRLLAASWCNARRGNAICMPRSHLPATKLIHYALFICLQIHTYARAHAELRLGSLQAAARVFVCACFKVDALSPSKRDLCIVGSPSFFLLRFDMISFFICLKSICNPMQELIPLHTHTHTHTSFVNLFGLCNTSGRCATDPD